MLKIMLEDGVLQQQVLLQQQVPQLLSLSMQLLVSHIWLIQNITQVLQPWIQMLTFGKELQSMTVKSMVRKNIKRMPTTSRLTEFCKKMLPTLDYHMLQLLSR